MNTFKKYILYGVLGITTIGCTSVQAYSFFDKMYWSHCMSNLSHFKQKEGFLLNDLQFEAQQMWTAINTRDAREFTKLLAQKNNFELVYHIHHCLDIELNHAETKDKLTDDLIKLVTVFNEQIAPVTQATFATLSAQRRDAIKNAYDALTKFTTTYGIASANTREVLKDLQKDAQDRAIQSVLRKEYIIPAVAVAAVVGGLFFWNKWFSTKFWNWWNSMPELPKYKPLSNNDFKINDALCKGEELTLSNHVRIVQTRVGGQSGATCGYHALYNTTLLIDGIRKQNLSHNDLLDNDRSFRTNILPDWEQTAAEFVTNKVANERRNIEIFLNNPGTTGYTQQLTQFKTQNKIEATAELTQEQKERFLTQESERVRRNYMAHNGRDIDSRTIEELIRVKAAPYQVKHDIITIDSPERDIPTHATLLQAIDNEAKSIVDQNLKQLATDDFIFLKQRLNLPGQHVFGIILGNMKQAGDNSGSSGHWISLVIYKAADGSRHYIIADSCNGRNLENANVRRVITALEGEDVFKTIKPV